MQKYWYALSLAIGIPLLTWAFTTITFGAEADRLFLTISTFLFSIFTGFFVSRQASRFNRIRETVSAFDGQMSSAYRMSGHISETLQAEIGKIIIVHYTKILESKEWHIHFTQPSTTLTQLHTLLEKHIIDDDVTKLSNQAIGALVKGLAKVQSIRKQMIALYAERIPREQWVLIIFFALILIATVSTVPSVADIFGSLLKAAFVASVLSVVLILYRLNNLAYTERIMGERSAHDVLGIIADTR